MNSQRNEKNMFYPDLAFLGTVIGNVPDVNYDIHNPLARNEVAMSNLHERIVHASKK